MREMYIKYKVTYIFSFEASPNTRTRRRVRNVQQNINYCNLFWKILGNYCNNKKKLKF